MHTYCTKQVVFVLQAWRPDEQSLSSKQNRCVSGHSLLSCANVAGMGMVECDNQGASVETQ